MLIRSNSQYCETDSVAKPEGWTGIKSNVIFGSPRQDCNGTGICQIASFDGKILQRKNNNCSATIGYVSAQSDGAALRIKFRKTDLCCRLYANHFYKGQFKMTDACQLSAALCKQYGIQHSILKPGTYKVVEADGWIHVDLILM